MNGNSIVRAGLVILITLIVALTVSSVIKNQAEAKIIASCIEEDGNKMCDAIIAEKQTDNERDVAYSQEERKACLKQTDKNKDSSFCETMARHLEKGNVEFYDTDI